MIPAASTSTQPVERPARLTNRSLLLPFALPYFAYVGIAAIPVEILAVGYNYALRIVAVGALLAWSWRRYPRLTGPKNPWGSLAAGAGAGLAGCSLWIALLTPFASGDAKSWDDGAFALRLAAAGLLVPLFEELFMRGFIFRLAYQWDMARKEGAEEPLATALDERSVAEVSPGAWTFAAAAISTLAFTAGHQTREWPAALAFGTLMIGLWVWRKDLLSCIAAHGVANVGLALYVRSTGAWGLW